MVKKVIQAPQLTAREKAIIGRLLVEILSGTLTDAMLANIHILEGNKIPEPYGRLVRYVGGDARSGEELVKAAQNELRIICEELLGQ
jgi:hypothetical protein